MDYYKNFAYSTVLTAPVPAASGTSLIVAAGEGAYFPTVPFNATIWPASVIPRPTNAEIVRVTLIVGDTLTITRTQEGTSARTIIVGDQISAAWTNKSITDLGELYRLDLLGIPDPEGVLTCISGTCIAYDPTRPGYIAVFGGTAGTNTGWV